MGFRVREHGGRPRGRAARLALALLLGLIAAPAMHAQAEDTGDEPPPQDDTNPAVAARNAREAEYKAYRQGLADGWPAEFKAIEKRIKSLERAEKLYRIRRDRSKTKKAPTGVALKGRMKSVRQLAQVQVDLGLAWLAAHQSPEGFWSAAAFDTECGRLAPDTICPGTGSPHFDVGVTGLALLSYLRAGHTPSQGRYAPTVRAALDYLIAVQSKDGMLGVEILGQSTYDHIIATLALLEAADATGSYREKAAAQKGLDKMFTMRNPGAAWRYQPHHPVMLENPNDTSVTGWAAQAMAAGRRLEMEVDAEAWVDALAFIEAMTDPATARTGYYDMGGRPAREVGKDKRWPSELTESMTAIGLLCRLLLEPDAGSAENQLRKRQAALVGRLPPTWDSPGRIDYYFWYQGSQALALHGGSDLYAWADGLTGVAAAHELEADDAVGSWDPQRGPWGDVGGRVYSTAMMTLSMLALVNSE